MTNKNTSSQSPRLSETYSSQMSKDEVRAQTFRLNEAFRATRDQGVDSDMTIDPSILLFQALHLAA